MKKFITIIVAFMSVLTLWGQTDEDKYINDCLNFFQENEDKVIQQARENHFIEDKDTLLINVVVNDAKYLSNHSGICDTLLYPEITTQLIEFCEQYYQDITSINEEGIAIDSNKFFITIKTYQKLFKLLRTLVEEAERKSKLYSDDNSSSSISLPNVLLILILVICISGVVLTVLTLNEVKKKNKEAKKPKTNTSEKANIEVPNKKSHKDKTKDKTGVQTTDTSSVPPGTESAYPTQPSMQYNNVVATPSAVPERKENINKVPQETYLYAIANANVNGEIGLYKVTTENSGDKVFMIILKKADDENGDFTIAPMSDNFMRVAIADRNTYLPSQFCESTLNSPNPTRIEVIEKGKARKVGGKWQMQERMKIRLI